MPPKRRAGGPRLSGRLSHVAAAAAPSPLLPPAPLATRTPLAILRQPEPEPEPEPSFREVILRRTPEGFDLDQSPEADIAEIDAGFPAAAVDFLPHSRIVAVGGRPVRGIDDVSLTLHRLQSASEVTFTVSSPDLSFSELAQRDTGEGERLEEPQTVSITFEEPGPLGLTLIEEEDGRKLLVSVKDQSLASPGDSLASPHRQAVARLEQGQELLAVNERSVERDEPLTEVLAGLKDAARPLTLTFSAEEFELTPLPDKWQQLAGSNPFDTPARGTPPAFHAQTTAATGPAEVTDAEDSPDAEDSADAEHLLFSPEEEVCFDAQAAEEDSGLAAERAEQERLAAIDAELQVGDATLASPLEDLHGSIDGSSRGAGTESPLSDLKPGLRYYGEDKRISAKDTDGGLFVGQSGSPGEVVSGFEARLAQMGPVWERKAAEKAEQERLAAEAAEGERDVAALMIQRHARGRWRIAAARVLAAERALEAYFEHRSASPSPTASPIPTEADRLAAEQAEQDRLAAEMQEVAQRVAPEKVEQDRLATEQAEAERLAAEQAEQERAAEVERLAAGDAQRERLARLEADTENAAATARSEEAERVAKLERKAVEDARLAARIDHLAMVARQAEAARLAAEETAETEKQVRERVGAEMVSVVGRLAAEAMAREDAKRESIAVDAEAEIVAVEAANRSLEAKIEAAQEAAERQRGLAAATEEEATQKKKEKEARRRAAKADRVGSPKSLLVDSSSDDNEYEGAKRTEQRGAAKQPDSDADGETLADQLRCADMEKDKYKAKMKRREQAALDKRIERQLMHEEKQRRARANLKAKMRDEQEPVAALAVELEREEEEEEEAREEEAREEEELRLARQQLDEEKAQREREEQKRQEEMTLTVERLKAAKKQRDGQRALEREQEEAVERERAAASDQKRRDDQQRRLEEKQEEAAAQAERWKASAKKKSKKKREEQLRLEQAQSAVEEELRNGTKRLRDEQLRLEREEEEAEAARAAELQRWSAAKQLQEEQLCLEKMREEQAELEAEIERQKAAKRLRDEQTRLEREEREMNEAKEAEEEAERRRDAKQKRDEQVQRESEEEERQVVLEVERLRMVKQKRDEELKLQLESEEEEAEAARAAELERRSVANELQEEQLRLQREEELREENLKACQRREAKQHRDEKLRLEWEREELEEAAETAAAKEAVAEAAAARKAAAAQAVRDDELRREREDVEAREAEQRRTSKMRQEEQDRLEQERARMDAEEEHVVALERQQAAATEKKLKDEQIMVSEERQRLEEAEDAEEEAEERRRKLQALPSLYSPAPQSQQPPAPAAGGGGGGGGLFASTFVKNAIVAQYTQDQASPAMKLEAAFHPAGGALNDSVRSDMTLSPGYLQADAISRVSDSDSSSDDGGGEEGRSVAEITGIRKVAPRRFDIDSVDDSSSDDEWGLNRPFSSRGTLLTASSLTAKQNRLDAGLNGSPSVSIETAEHLAIRRMERKTGGAVDRARRKAPADLASGRALYLQSKQMRARAHG